MRLSRHFIALILVAIAASAGAQATLVARGDPATRRVRLVADTIVDGIRCAPTGNAYAEFFVDGGRLAECPLAENASVDGHDFPRGTWVILRPDRSLRLAWLSRDTRIGDVTCKGTGYKDWVTTFHENGRLQTCFLPETTTIQGIPCRRASIFGEITGGVAIHFHDNGRLRSCALARPTTIAGERHRAWSRVHLDEEGRPSIDEDRS